MDWDGPNQDAIKNGGSPYAITVDLDNTRESVFKNNQGLWEPHKSVLVNIGKAFTEEQWKKANHKINAKKHTVTPTGLYYTNGGRWRATSGRNRLLGSIWSEW